MEPAACNPLAIYDMIEIADATEDEMIAAFLRAEIDSSRYSASINALLAQLGRDRGIVDTPARADPAENLARKSILRGYRGYPNQLLFTGFPTDVIWRRVQLEPRDFDDLRYANDARVEGQLLMTLSGGTRRVTDGARNLIQVPPNAATAHIRQIVAALHNGQAFAPLITAESEDGSLILIEGHSRATAYVIERFAGNVEAFVASSPSLSRWALY
jgi:hypothetical protein